MIFWRSILILLAFFPTTGHGQELQPQDITDALMDHLGQNYERPVGVRFLSDITTLNPEYEVALASNGVAAFRQMGQPEILILVLSLDAVCRFSFHQGNASDLSQQAILNLAAAFRNAGADGTCSGIIYDFGNVQQVFSEFTRNKFVWLSTDGTNIPIRQRFREEIGISLVSQLVSNMENVSEISAIGVSRVVYTNQQEAMRVLLVDSQGRAANRSLCTESLDAETRDLLVNEGVFIDDANALARSIVSINSVVDPLAYVLCQDGS